MCRGVTFAEPYILLSQLHWAYNYGSDPLHSAKQFLYKLVDMHSAKREFFTNLGLFIYATERDGTSALSCSVVLPLIRYAAGLTHFVGDAVAVAAADVAVDVVAAAPRGGLFHLQTPWRWRTQSDLC